jgi:hypothetical protein
MLVRDGLLEGDMVSWSSQGGVCDIEQAHEIAATEAAKNTVSAIRPFMTGTRMTGSLLLELDDALQSYSRKVT